MCGKGLSEGDCGVFLQHLQYLGQVSAEFFDGFTLGVRTWDSWHMAHQQSRVWITFNLNGRYTKASALLLQELCNVGLGSLERLHAAIDIPGERDAGACSRYDRVGHSFPGELSYLISVQSAKSRLRVFHAGKATAIEDRGQGQGLQVH